VQERIDNPSSFGTVSPSAYSRRNGQSIAALLAILLPYILSRLEKQLLWSTLWCRWNSRMDSILHGEVMAN
jgi:cell division inhibitor SulA